MSGRALVSPLGEATAALGSSGWRGRSLLDVTHRRGYTSRGRTARDTPKALVTGLVAWENEDGPGAATNCVPPGLTPSERG